METEPYIQQDVLTFLKEKEGQPRHRTWMKSRHRA